MWIGIHQLTTLWVLSALKVFYWFLTVWRQKKKNFVIVILLWHQQLISYLLENQIYYLVDVLCICYGCYWQGPLREVVEAVQREVVDGDLLRDCLEVGSNDLKGLIQIIKDFVLQFYPTLQDQDDRSDLWVLSERNLIFLSFFLSFLGLYLPLNCNFFGFLVL